MIHRIRNQSNLEYKSKHTQRSGVNNVVCSEMVALFLSTQEYARTKMAQLQKATPQPGPLLTAHIIEKDNKHLSSWDRQLGNHFLT